MNYALKAAVDLVRIPSEGHVLGREVIDREAVVEIAMRLKNSSDETAVALREAAELLRMAGRELGRANQEPVTAIHAWLKANDHGGE